MSKKSENRTISPLTKLSYGARSICDCDISRVDRVRFRVNLRVRRVRVGERVIRWTHWHTNGMLSVWPKMTTANR